MSSATVGPAGWLDGASGEVVGFSAMLKPPIIVATAVKAVHTAIASGNQEAAKTDKNLVDLNDPLNFLEECHRLGAGGMQFPLGIRDQEYQQNLRKKAGQYEMQVQASLGLPKNETELDRFEQQVITAKNVGAAVARVTVNV